MSKTSVGRSVEGSPRPPHVQLVHSCKPSGRLKGQSEPVMNGAQTIGGTAIPYVEPTHRRGCTRATNA